TEAYLALAAFCMFLRRLRAIHHHLETEDAGVEVLMRYTLRLLTSQQFQRAAGLMCAMEHLRRADPSQLGMRPFKIGLWIGGTPNSRDQAIRAYRAHLQEGEWPDHAILVLDRCPWCRAALGEGKRGQEKVLHGYDRRATSSGASTIVARCPDLS